MCVKALISIFLCLFFSVAEAEETIGIFTYKVLGVNPWDPDSVKMGIAGSEEAVIYVAEKLAKIGYRVLVYADPPQGSLHSLPGANPRYVDVNFDDKTFLDIAIAWRQPYDALRLKGRAKKVYLWPHDTFHSKMAASEIEAFDDVLWLSEWQRRQWISVNPPFAKFTKIFGNAINPESERRIQRRDNPYSCIYGSNYARGLDVLLNIWPNIRQRFPKATLDIYYGWQHWGLLSREKEADMRAQIAALRAFGVQDHGKVGHEELQRAYERASFWTYPCTDLETFCITAIRAQLAGAMPVIIEGSALSETVRHGFKCPSSEDYEKTLLQALQQAENITLEERKKMGEFILNEFTWEILAKKWAELFSRP